MVLLEIADVPQPDMSCSARNNKDLMKMCAGPRDQAESGLRPPRRLHAQEKNSLKATPRFSVAEWHYCRDNTEVLRHQSWA
jgi:hypothetical protein